MSSQSRKDLPRSMEAILEKPFDGLLGDTAELRVLQEIVADPYTDYTHHDLMELTGLSDPSVRRGVKVLVDHGIIRNISKARRNPLYRANLDSRKLTALTFLSYAFLDERTGSKSMDDAIMHYCEPGSVYIDFLDLQGVAKRGKSSVNGMRVFVPDDASSRLREVLQDVLKKAGRKGRIEKVQASS